MPYVRTVGSKCPRKPCDRVSVYVGQTWWSPEERFQHHMNGTDPGVKKWVEQYGLHLRKRLVLPKGEIRGRREAEAAERALAVALDNKGFCVYGGH